MERVVAFRGKLVVVGGGASVSLVDKNNTQKRVVPRGADREMTGLHVFHWPHD